MTMKKYISIVLFASALLFVSCEPLKDIYNDLDSKEKSITKQDAITLTADHYDAIAKKYIEVKLKGNESDTALKERLTSNANRFKSNQAFDKNVTAEEMIPYLLPTFYPEWGKGSVVTATYNELLPTDSKISGLGKTAFVALTKDELAAVGVASLSNVTSEQLAKVIETAQKKDTTGAKSILIKGTIDKNNIYWFATNGKPLSDTFFHLISWSEYQEMGNAYRYGNFSASASDALVVPTLLSLKYPYAVDGNSKGVISAFYNSSTKVTSCTVKKYTRTGGVWVLEKSQSVTSQFIYSTKGWVFDPTIKFALGTEDFAFLHKWVQANKPDYISKNYPTNEEFWFGGSGYYKNFNVDGGNTVGPRPEEDGLSADALLKARHARVVDGLLLLLADKFPANPAQVNGIDQKYILDVEIREARLNARWLYTFKGLGSGKFEFEGKAAKN